MADPYPLLVRSISELGIRLTTRDSHRNPAPDSLRAKKLKPKT